MDVIVGYMQNMWLYMMITTPMIIVFRIYKIKKSNKIVNYFHEIGVVFFFIFFIGLLSQTIIPNVLIKDGSVVFINGSYQATNLEFFRVLSETYNAIRYLNYWQPFLINFIGNIVMFIPIGFLLPLIWKKFKNGFVTVGMGFLISLSIEILQLPQMRSSDVDDLWLNTLGTLLGYFVFLFIPKTVRARFK